MKNECTHFSLSFLFFSFVLHSLHFTSLFHSIKITHSFHSITFHLYFNETEWSEVEWKREMRKVVCFFLAHSSLNYIKMREGILSLHSFFHYHSLLLSFTYNVMKWWVKGGTNPINHSLPLPCCWSRAASRSFFTFY